MHRPSSRPTFVKLALRLALALALASQLPARPARATESYRFQQLYGWNLAVDERLYQDPKPLGIALQLTGVQLANVVRAVPAKALRELRRVTIWFSPAYPGEEPKGAYHPSRDWLAEHGRDVRMAKAVELSNVGIFEQECSRMPSFVLHELAHAYHDRVLGFDNPEIKAAFAQAQASGRYNSVERRNGLGRPNTLGTRSYAMENEREYFAESSEALFGTNDFYPFNEPQLRTFDPVMHRLLKRLWGADGYSLLPDPARQLACLAR